MSADDDVLIFESACAGEDGYDVIGVDCIFFEFDVAFEFCFCEEQWRGWFFI